MPLEIPEYQLRHRGNLYIDFVVIPILSVISGQNAFTKKSKPSYQPLVPQKGKE